MAKFELLNLGQDKTLKEFGGDYLLQDNQYVQIMRSSRHSDRPDEIIVAITLSPGQFLRKCEEPGGNGL